MLNPKGGVETQALKERVLMTPEGSQQMLMHQKTMFLSVENFGKMPRKVSFCITYNGAISMKD